MLSTYWQDVKNWAAKPYDEQGNVLSWFLFIGFTLCATYLWSRVIRDIVE